MSIFFVMSLLGIVQGLTEFLPVSSSGHLVLLSKVFGIKESLFVSIILHVATLLSIVVVFRKDIWYYIKNPLSPGVLKLMIATIPTCLIVFVIMPFVNQSFEGTFLPYCFLLTSIVLFFTDFMCSKKIKFVPMGRLEDFCGINYKQAIFMGIAQGLAVFPGISRSGATICGGVLSGGDKQNVARFSFLMSIPIILLSLIKEVYDISTNSSILQVDWIGLIIGGILAFVIGILAIKFMIRITQTVKFRWFALYLLLIGIVSIFLLR